MHILLLTDGVYPLRIGGMQRHSRRLIHYFLEANIDVTVVHPGDQYGNGSLLNDFPKASEILIPFEDNSKLPGHYLRALKRYAKRIQCCALDFSKFDIIYIQGFGGIYLEINQPKILNLHGFEMFQPTANFKSKVDAIRLKKLAHTAMNKADFIYSFGGKIDDLLFSLGIPQSKIIHQMNGVDESWLRESEIPEEKCTEFIFIGRSERRKGIYELNEAIEKVSEQLNFTFVGPIKQQEQLVRMNVKYLGLIKDEEEIKQLLDQKHCLVCPSYSEGMPTVIAEAMARGCAIIATDVGAISRQYGDNGVLLTKPDPELIAKAIKSLTELSPQEFKVLRENSLQKAKQDFTWKKIISDKIKFFEKLIG